MTQWDEVSGEARETMRFLGYFKPTVNPANKARVADMGCIEVKGWIEEEGKTYLNSTELREMAVHFVEVANWLDKRAAEAANAK